MANYGTDTEADGGPERMDKATRCHMRLQGTESRYALTYIVMKRL